MVPSPEAKKTADAVCDYIGNCLINPVLKAVLDVQVREAVAEIIDSAPKTKAKKKAAPEQLPLAAEGA